MQKSDIVGGLTGIVQKTFTSGKNQEMTFGKDGLIKATTDITKADPLRGSGITKVRLTVVNKHHGKGKGSDRMIGQHVFAESSTERELPQVSDTLSGSINRELESISHQQARPRKTKRRAMAGSRR